MTTLPEQAPQFTTEKNTAWSLPGLPEAPNITILGQGHAPGTENVTENIDGVAAGAKRHERGILRSHPNLTKRQTSIKKDSQQRLERSDPDARTRGPPRGGACPGHIHERGGLAAEVRTNGGHDHTAVTRRRRPGLAHGQGPNIVTIAEVAVRAGSRRKSQKKYAKRIEVWL